MQMLKKPRAGVCIVRAEVQGDRLLITFMANTSVTRTLRSVHPLPTRHFVHIGDATDAVDEFLRRFGIAAAEQCNWSDERN
jgi:hypothetical protein